MKFLFTPTKMAATKDTGHNKCLQGYRETGTLCIRTGCKMGRHFGNQCIVSWDPSVPLPEVPQRMGNVCPCETQRTPAVGHTPVIQHSEAEAAGGQKVPGCSG